jgi:archaemetzincin
LCSNECVIGENERGYCGLRTVRDGKLVHLADRAAARAIIALPRLRQSFDLPDDAFLFRERTVKEAVRELGHTFGLSHCRDRRCVMAFSNSLADTDYRGQAFCARCRNRV